MCSFKQWAPRMEPHDPVNKQSLRCYHPPMGTLRIPPPGGWADSIDSISSGWSPAIATGKASQPQHQAQECRFSQLIWGTWSGMVILSCLNPSWHSLLVREHGAMGVSKLGAYHISSFPRVEGCHKNTLCLPPHLLVSPFPWVDYGLCFHFQFHPRHSLSGSMPTTRAR